MKTYDPQHPNRHDVVVREPRRRQDKTPIYVAGGALAVLLAGALFWSGMAHEDYEKTLADDHVVTETHDTHVTVPAPTRDTFVERSTLEVRDMRSNADRLALQATDANRDRIQAYQNRVSELESRLNRAETNGTAAAESKAQVESELTALRDEYEQLRSDTEAAAEQARVASNQAAVASNQAGDAAARTDLIAFTQQAETRLDALEERLDQLLETPQGEPLGTQLSRLDEEVDDLSEQVDDMRTTADNTEKARMKQQIEVALDNLEDRMHQIDTEVSTTNE